MKNLIAFFIIFNLIIPLTSCGFENTQKGTNEDLDGLKAQLNNSENLIVDFPYDIPNGSSQITNFPWENDSKFIEAKKSNKTDVLIAGFCTVINITSQEEEHNVHLAAKSISGSVVQPGEVFSQNKSIGPYTEEKGYKEGIAYIGGVLTPSIGGGACKIASTLYNLSVLSNLEIVERYNHSMPVHYLPYGQDATVAYGFKDLKFKNTTDHPILIWAMPIKNRVYMGFYGKEKAPEVKWSHNVLEKRATPTQYQVNPSLNEGEEKVIIEGMDGAKVESSVTIKYSDGTEENKSLGISNYWPMARIIEVKNKPVR